LLDHLAPDRVAYLSFGRQRYAHAIIAIAAFGGGPVPPRVLFAPVTTWSVVQAAIYDPRALRPARHGSRLSRTAGP
jgi:hypothetical protein